MSWDKEFGGLVGDSTQNLFKDMPGDGVNVLYNYESRAEHDHLVSHDGLNADFIREGGEVIVDNGNFGAGPPL